MQGKKTHEQQIRTLERKPDIPDRRREESRWKRGPELEMHEAKPGVRQSEFPVSEGGFNQESHQNKHNHTTQQGHKPQKHSPKEEGD